MMSAGNLAKLRQDMPLVFELRDRLVLQVAEATADYHLKIDRLRHSGLSDGAFESAKRLAYDRHYASTIPIHEHIKAIDMRVANILALMPPPPMVYTSGSHAIPEPR